MQGQQESARIFPNASNKLVENQALVEFIENGNLKLLEGFVTR